MTAEIETAEIEAAGVRRIVADDLARTLVGEERWRAYLARRARDMTDIKASIRRILAEDKAERMTKSFARRHTQAFLNRR